MKKGIVVLVLVFAFVAAVTIGIVIIEQPNWSDTGVQESLEPEPLEPIPDQPNWSDTDTGVQESLEPVWSSSSVSVCSETPSEWHLEAEDPFWGIEDDFVSEQQKLENLFEDFQKLSLHYKVALEPSDEDWQQLQAYAAEIVEYAKKPWIFDQNGEFIPEWTGYYLGFEEQVELALLENPAIPEEMAEDIRIHWGIPRSQI